MVLLYKVVGASMFAGVGTIVAILSSNAYLAKQMRAASNLVMERKDERTDILTQIFSSVQNIKLNATELHVQRQVIDVRNRELVQIRRVLLIGAMNVFLLWLAPLLVSSVTFAVYVCLPPACCLRR